MPFVRIELPSHHPANYRTAVGDAVQEALHATLDVPMEERFQIVSDHAPGALIVDPSYLGIDRSSDAIVIQVTLNQGRTADLKKSFYRALADLLHERVGLRREDLTISLVEVQRENWSFGNGDAQLI